MKTIISLALALTLMQSCVKDAVVCTIEVGYCNGGIDTVEYRGYSRPKIYTYKRAVPIIDGTNGWGTGGGTQILNVCKFRILK